MREFRVLTKAKEKLDYLEMKVYRKSYNLREISMESVS